MNKDIAEITLERGSHLSPEQGLCAMEAVAWIAGESHSDRPKCASPVLAAYVRNLNDGMPDKQRQRLKPYVLRLLNSANRRLDQRRAEVLAWAAITEFAPLALRAAGLAGHADKLSTSTFGDWRTAANAAHAAAYAANVAADAAANTANAAANAAAYAAAYAANVAADAAANTANAATRAVAKAAYAAANTANAAARAVAKAAYAADAANATHATYAAANAAADAAAYAAGATIYVAGWDLALAALDRALEVSE